MELLKAIIELIREAHDYKRDYRRLQKATLDYAALQHIVDTAVSKNVVVTVKLEDNAVITITPTEESKRANPKTFRERFMESREGR